MFLYVLVPPRSSHMHIHTHARTHTRVHTHTRAHTHFIYFPSSPILSPSQLFHVSPSTLPRLPICTMSPHAFLSVSLSLPTTNTYCFLSFLLLSLPLQLSHAPFLLPLSSSLSFLLSCSIFTPPSHHMHPFPSFSPSQTHVPSLPPPLSHSRAP